MFARLLCLLIATGACVAHAASALQWDWLSPAPHRQSWRQLASGNNTVVGLTDGFGGRSIYTWAGLSNWVAVTTPTNFVPLDVNFAGGQFIAVGNNSTVINSKDGIDWKIRHTDASGSYFNKVASSGGTHVVAAGGPYIYYSKDLTRWTQVRLGEDYFYITSVAYGNGRFVAFGQAGNVFVSTDGVNWNRGVWPQGLMPLDLSSYVSGLAFNNGIFVLAVPGAGTACSMNGLNWTVQSHQSFYGIGAGGNGFVGLEQNTVSVSATGGTWSSVLDADVPVGYRLTCSTYINGKTIIAGEAGILYSSDDQINWQRLVKAPDYRDSKIEFGDGIFLRYGGESGVCISTEGATWQRIETAPGLKAAVYGNGRWVGFDHASNVVTSITGKTWQTNSNSLGFGRRLIFADGKFVAEVDGGFISSFDGVTWTLAPLAFTNRNFVGNANGVWLAILDGQPATSPDAIHWTIHPAQPDIAAKFYAAGNGRFIGVGGAGMGPGFCVWSTNGVTWQKSPLGIDSTTHAETSLTFAGGLFFMTDDYGGVFHSEDGLRWFGGRQATQTFWSAAFGNGQWLVCGGDAVLGATARLQSNSSFKLELVQQNFSAWTLSISGNAGAKFVIEASSDLDGAWSDYISITIPPTGQAVMPTDFSTGIRFFRARASAAIASH